MPDVILFDGVCNFCNASINFVIDRDAARRFRFASLQSDFGQRLLADNQRQLTDFDTVLLLRDGKLYEKSDAALEIARYLKGWSWLYLFRVVPRFIRDFFYDIIAKNRYRLFGKSESCRIPTPEEKKLFVIE
ncbi:thiol-disulfide oxidoreductase DCC family protein [Runella salmonicolor]|uniref:DCC1-like thiol-disulfide oxidoreductase family protein n=1 Tax=Runella salmonicolor TaxID=2950278 RepID=A0ABT1FXS9_9BACT|nr:DCC1-like thiol-disulfide oxidoreductase family protein [Runella salmonicolor]MCP1385558.1 DCC1-like thiol-disulfide oxidoreductase family protein [Runella salmonicolor]